MTDAGPQRAMPRAARDGTKKKRLRADRAHAEAALSASEEKYRAILEMTTDAVILMGADSVIQYANRAIEQMFGYASDEMIGKNLSVLQPERLRQQHRDGLRRYLDTGMKVLNWRGAEVIGMHRDGHEFPIEAAFNDIMMDGQRMFVGYLRDITERKQDGE